MLTTLVTIKAFVPRLAVENIKYGDLDSLLKASRPHSENISITKRTSANKSMTISLADILETIRKMSTAEARNDDKRRLLLKDTFKKKVDLTLPLHLSNMKKEDDNNYACYKFSDKLRGKKWRNCTMDGLNITLRGDSTKSLSLKGQYGKKISPSVGLHFKISQRMFQWKQQKIKERNT
jgi:hypothetical protein